MELRTKRRLLKIVNGKRLNQGRSGAKPGSHVSLMKPMMSTRSRVLKGKYTYIKGLEKDIHDSHVDMITYIIGWI